jgi:hypothetical protein
MERHQDFPVVLGWTRGCEAGALRAGILGKLRPLAALTLLLAVFAAGVPAQSPPDKKEFQPYIGLPGKDVLWLPAEGVMVNKMLDLARVSPEDLVMDLGSGDGRTVIAAAKRGARALGVEYNSQLLEYSMRLAAQEGVADRAQFVKADLFQYDLSQASVITLFLLPSINLELRPKLLGLKPGTRIVSNTFTMNDWQHDDMITDESKPECSFNCIAYLWIVPARVEGVWRFAQGDVMLTQEFQILAGTLKAGNKSSPITGRLRGDRISLSAGDTEYTGRVNGDTITGGFRTGSDTGNWRATRVSK